MKVSDVINEELEKQERGISWLADKIDMKYKTLYDKLKNDTVRGEELLKMAKVLNIDLNKLKEEI